MRIAVFRATLTINGSPDPSAVLVDRLGRLGHQTLHLTGVAPPGREIAPALARDLVSQEAVEAFGPQAIVLCISDPSHEYFPREWIDKVVSAGGTAIYVGPAGGPCPAHAPAVRFLAERGFHFASPGAGGPLPIRSSDSARILTRPPDPSAAEFEGVHFVEVRTPYLLSNRIGQTNLLSVDEGDARFWDGRPLSGGSTAFAATRTTAGREILLTGDWLSPQSLTALACNLQLIVNLLVGRDPSTPPAVATKAQQAAAPESPVANRGAKALISADPISAPFVELAKRRLRARGYDVVVSMGAESDDALSSACAFVPLIDANFSPRQERETEEAFQRSRTDPHGFRIVPINFRPGLDEHGSRGVLRELARWVWLPGFDSSAWDAMFEALIGVLERPAGRFVWRSDRPGRRAFVSYSFRDRVLATTLGQRLEECGVEVFLADDTALMNAPLREELARLIDDCDLFVPLITPTYRASNWSFVEAEIAVESNRRTGRPGILCAAPQGDRVPRWYAGAPVCRDLDSIRDELALHKLIDETA